MFKNKKAIFWDNDGVLVDTEKYYYEANRQIMERFGVNLTRELYVELFLLQSKGAWHLLEDRNFSFADINNLRKERDALYFNLLLKEDILIEGVQDVLEYLKKKYEMAIVTSSKSIHFNLIHSRTGLLKYFKFAVTADDYLKSKPNPEPYLVALKKMGVSHAESIAIEDSQRGLIAAKSAVLQCIVIPNALTMHSNFEDADYKLTSISEIVKIL